MGSPSLGLGHLPYQPGALSSEASGEDSKTKTGLLGSEKEKTAVYAAQNTRPGGTGQFPRQELWLGVRDERFCEGVGMQKKPLDSKQVDVSQKHFL